MEMQSLLGVARLVLAAVFLVAGTTALLNRESYATTLQEFKVPAFAIQPLGMLLPVLELIIGGALLVTRYAWSGAVAGETLLAIYTAALGYKLLKGERPSCNCFGQFSAEPISYKTIVRNLSFLLIGGLLVSSRAEVEVHHFSQSFGLINPALDQVAPVFLAVAVLAFFGQSWLLYHLFHQNGRLIVKMDNIELRLKAAGIEEVRAEVVSEGEKGLPIGRIAPEFSLSQIGHGKGYSLGQLKNTGRPILLIFSDLGCGPCKELVPYIAHWQKRFGHLITIAVITRGTQEETSHASATTPYLTLVQRDREVAQLYDALVTPSAVLISREGAIASSVAMGAKQISELLHSTVGPLQSPTKSESVSLSMA